MMSSISHRDLSLNREKYNLGSGNAADLHLCFFSASVFLCVLLHAKK